MICNDMNRIDLPTLLQKYDIRPKKSLGQNFLWDPNILQQITRSAELPPGAQVLEIGAGAGTLTRHLAAEAERVVAVEIDQRMSALLQEVVHAENVEIVIGDMLKMDPEALGLKDGYHVVANIPYYITSSLFRHLLEAKIRPSRMVLTLQYEVAQRICELPGNLNLLALSVQLYGHPRVISRIPAGAFYPRPKVDSAVLRVDLHPQPRINPQQISLFFSLAKAGFMQKRKKIRNSLAAGMHLPADAVENLLVLAGIDPGNRAQALDFQDWSRLVQIWEEKLNSD